MSRIRPIPEERIQNLECYATLPDPDKIDKVLDILYDSMAIEIANKLRKFKKYKVIVIEGQPLKVHTRIELIVPWPSNGAK